MSTVNNRPGNGSPPDSATDKTPDTLISDPIAFGLLLFVVGCVGGAGWLLAQAQQFVVVGQPPPLLPFVLILVAALGLLAGYQRRKQRSGVAAPVDATPEPASLPPVLAALGFTALPAGLRHRQTLVLLGAILLTILVLIMVPGLGMADSYLFVFILWLVAIILYIGAIVMAEAPAGQSWRAYGVRARGKAIEVWTHHRLALLLLVVIISGAFLLRVIAVGTVPHNLGGDEASQGLEAIRVLNGEIRNPFTTGWLGVPTMSFYFNSLSIGLFGATTFALRLPWVLVGTATVLVTFFLVRRLTNLPLGLATAALVAVYHYHIHYSRLGSNQVADPLFVALALLFLYRALDGKKLLDWALTGLICALALYFYAGARFTPVIVGVVLFYAFIRAPRQFITVHRRGVGALLGAFLIAGAPMLQYAWRFPDDFNARINQVGIIQSGWLENEVLLTGRSTLTILWDQFRRAALVFNYYPDRTVWYGLREPLLDPFFGVLFLLGLAYGTLRSLGDARGQRFFPLVAWWWGGIILGGMLTESPPSTQRLITTSIPACFFVALALWELLQLLEQAVNGLPKKAILLVGVLVFAVISLQTYFVEFSPQRIYGGPYAELGTDLAPQLNAWADTHYAYFVGPPWMYWGFSTLPYLAPDIPGEDVVEPLASPEDVAELPPGRNGVFVVLPQRENELAHIQAAYPRGELREVRAETTDQRLMAYLYLVPAQD